MSMEEVTGAEAGLSGNDQIMIALKAIINHGGSAQITEIYSAVEEHLNGKILSEQGRASLRRLINSNAVQAGFIYPYDSNNPGWRITPEGKEFLTSRHHENEQVVNVDTGVTESAPAETVASVAFEYAVLSLMKRMYPHYAWYHQGKHKANERGLDLIGSPAGEQFVDYPSIGVQVKFHAPKNAPTDTEWLKFLAGCFARRIEQAIFVTTGRLSGTQRREAGEGKIMVIEGIESIIELCLTFSLDSSVFTDLITQRDGEG